MTDPMSIKLRELLFEQFDEDELAALCAEIGLDYASLPSAGAFGKTRDMVAMARSRNKLFTLVARVRDLRPEAFEALGLHELVADASAGEAAGLRSPARGSSRSSLADHGFGRLIPVLAVAGVAAFICMAVGALSILLSGQLAPAGGLPTPAPAQETPPAAAPAAPTTAGADAAAARATPAAPPAPVTPADMAPAAQAVVTINAQLIDFLEGRLGQETLNGSWANPALDQVLAFYRRLPSLLGVANPPPPGAISTNVVYVQQPALSSEAGDRAVVTSRERWTYANAASGRAQCETRDYTYTLVKDAAGAYRITGVEGRLLSSSCQVAP